MAAIYLSEKSPPQGKVFLCGNDAIADELKMVGVDFFGHGPGTYNFLRALEKKILTICSPDHNSLSLFPKTDPLQSESLQ